MAARSTRTSGTADPAAPPEASLGRFLAAYDAALARWPVPIEALTVRTPHGTTRVNACGPRDGRPLVLLHGGGATSTSWLANVGALASAGHRVLAVDLIGDPGRSILDGPPLNGVPGLLGWLDAVLDGLSVPEADLCGHSYGAWIALEYALHAPARIRRLALLDPTQCFAGLRPGYLLRVLPIFLPPRTAGRTRSYLDWETRGTGLDPAWREVYALGHAGFPATRPITGPRPARARLRALTAPTLVLLAEQSRPHDARRLADLARQALPTATVTVLPGLSHHNLLTARPAELNDHITEFLA
ncbi:alpha/beta fold hydrolase [Streptomyces sp. CB01881]|uniref:alpha/beta fold hydrolase n=1 Tax=Streptomyces sp. CB01881 TaxID=2078691 RepID=UPI000CDC6372|nr:alpha/beta fold hydrolase [Streptomyces sp. CB01881]AUY48587.1 alpha/beta hydrolase [Streptomyces sp. CB01881]TYC77080.1 alpha/beta fold hydrolase [Streptomyces sp. CB01881]